MLGEEVGCELFTMVHSVETGTCDGMSVFEEEISVESSCLVCLDLLFEPVKLKCGHMFCKSCSARARGYSSNCPLCRAEKAFRRSLKPDWVTQQKLKEEYPVNMERRRRELEGDSRSSLRRIKLAFKEVMKAKP